MSTNLVEAPRSSGVDVVDGIPYLDGKKVPTYLGVRLTIDEAIFIARLEKSSGYSRSDIGKAGLAKLSESLPYDFFVPHEVKTRLDKIALEISKVGININQLARKANRQGLSDADLKDSEFRLRQLVVMLRKKVNEPWQSSK